MATYKHKHHKIHKGNPKAATRAGRGEDASSRLLFISQGHSLLQLSNKYLLIVNINVELMYNKEVEGLQLSVKLLDL